MDASMSPEVGGMLTPPASSVTASHHPSPLPQPRRHPLRPGGPKESELIRYLDHGLNDVQKHVDNKVKKSRTEQDVKTPDGHAPGYTNFSEVEKALNGLLDVVWVSGSPNLQIPYLLNIARMIFEFIPLFPSSPHATFRVLDKLDSAFSGLLQGRDSDTNDPLPGFEYGRTIATTDKVRLKGIVERTRLVVAGKIGGAANEDDEGEDNSTEKTDESMAESDAEDTIKFEGFDNNDDDDDEDMEDDEWQAVKIAKVYERTIGELGDVLGGPPIGIITDD